MTVAPRRALALLGAVGLLVTLAPIAAAATSKQLTADGTAWYWKSQNRTTPSDITGQSCPEQVPVCPDPVIGLRNTHQQGALPVEVLNGEREKISSIQFDLSAILPAQGATIDAFTFSVIESPDPQDQAQTVNAAGKKIQACPITEFWEPSEEGGDEIADAPEYDCKQASAEGERKQGEPGRWEFDITTLAKDWGSDPTSANGVMLVGVETEESWQIVLKGPRRDDPATQDVDEQKENAKNIQATIEFTPNPAPPSPTTPPAPPTDGGEVSLPPTDFSTPPPTDFGFGDTPAPAPTEVPSPVTTPGSEIAGSEAADAGETGPETPGYVWALIPLGMVAFGLVRNSFAEPVAIRRPGGVVAIIRRQNAERRGAPAAPDAETPFAGIKRFFQRTGRGLKRAATKRSGS